MSTNWARSYFPIFRRYLRNVTVDKYNKGEEQQLVGLKRCMSSTFPIQNVPENPVRQSMYPRRFSTKMKGGDDKGSQSDTDEDITNMDEVDDERTSFPPETDPNLPSQYTDSVVYAVRTDQIVGKCLVKSSNAATKLFYEGKLRINNKKLLKKSTKVKNNDIIDLVHGEREQTLLITRVKVLKLLDSKTKSGKPKTAVRVWKKIFSFDRPKT